MDKQEVRRANVEALIASACGGSAAAFAEKTGIAPSYVSRMLYPPKKSGAKGIGERLADSIERAFDRPSGWLSSSHDGGGPSRAELPETHIIGPDADIELAYVTKVCGAQLSAGSGEVIWDMDEVRNSHGFRADYMRSRGLRAEKCKVWSVRGDSMEPRYRSGDIALIDMSDREPSHGKVFALVCEDGLRIKQLRRGASGWEMHSFNPDQNRYPPEPILSDNCAIIGRVRWRGGDED